MGVTVAFWVLDERWMGSIVAAKLMTTVTPQQIVFSTQNISSLICGSVIEENPCAVRRK